MREPFSTVDSACELVDACEENMAGGAFVVVEVSALMSVVVKLLSYRVVGREA